MKCGVFLPTTNNGYIYSVNSPQYMPTYALQREITTTAEECGYDFSLSMVKYRGFGGETDYWNWAQESTAVMAALVEATSTIKLWASVAIPTTNPAMLARTVATLDDASGGRFGVNIVGGWNRYEYEQMGLWPSDDHYRDRYARTGEFIDIMRGLWREGRLTHRGDFYTMDDCIVQPVPQHPITVIMPGQSAASLQIAARCADVNFVLGPLDELAQARRSLEEQLRETGRTCESAVLLGIIMAETDEEAAAQATHYMEGVDLGAQAGILAAASNDRSGTAAGVGLERQRGPVPPVVFEHPERAAFLQGSCWYSPVIVGSYARIARYLDDLEREAGMSSAVLTFADYTTDVRRFAAEVMPLMETLETP
ncbi:LLM class flavin-dependent oxidoreductase [Microbacterium sp. HA-8]|uniref:LLM class flavin-dependent oxidoreductase n=1 Tax=Microbacterium sp. HA-8 TaxID=3234200 RepID=UPI0038F6BE67